MGSGLTQQQIDFFQTNGYLFPLNAISSTKTSHSVAGSRLTKPSPAKRSTSVSRSRLTWLSPGCASSLALPAIVEAVQSLIGSDVLLFGSSAFCQKCARHTLRLLAPELGLLRPRPSRLRHGMDRVVACYFGERLPARSARKSPRARSGP